MYLIENYPEFISDVKKIWEDVIKYHNFEVCWLENFGVTLSNKDCVVILIIGADQRVTYHMKNPKTGMVYRDVLLYIFFGKKIDWNLVGGTNYPISEEEWINFYAEDNFQAICLVDLPLLKKEIIENWNFILEGNFDFESDFNKWELWYESKKETISNYEYLSFRDYLADQG